MTSPLDGSFWQWMGHLMAFLILVPELQSWMSGVLCHIVRRGWLFHWGWCIYLCARRRVDVPQSAPGAHPRFICFITSWFKVGSLNIVRVIHHGFIFQTWVAFIDQRLCVLYILTAHTVFRGKLCSEMLKEIINIYVARVDITIIFLFPNKIPK